eukprot:3233777-Rhodomonas_salina.1
MRCLASQEGHRDGRSSTALSVPDMADQLLGPYRTLHRERCAGAVRSVYVPCQPHTSHADRNQG